MKKIGVLTSGGDSQGMNAAVRAVVMTALDEGFEVIGIERGYRGLIDGHMKELTPNSVSEITNMGGTFLRSARCLEFKEEAGILKAVQTCKDFGIEGVVVVGGDGSFRGARDLSLHGIPCVAMPGTIDNDIVCTDYSIGFDTAVNICVDLIDKLNDTCFSHDRCSVVQIMGRGAGWMTLEAGIATGAASIIVPEVKFDFQKDVVDKLKNGQSCNKENFLVLVSEGVFAKTKSNVNYEYVVENNIDTIEKFAKAVEAATGIESRATVFGHVQRGGTPTAKDRTTAAAMGYHCVQLLKQGISNRVVVERKSEITDYDIVEGLNMTKPFDVERYNMAKILGM